MIIKPVEGRITEPFNGLRPLSKREKLSDPNISAAEKEKIKKTMHFHGAIDIAAKTGTPIIAPESGYVFIYSAIRPDIKPLWPEDVNLNNSDFPFKDYFYDIYGTIIILQVSEINSGKIKRTHIMAHMYGNQGFNKIYQKIEKIYLEEKAAKRFPIHCWYTKKHAVEQGDVIGLVGSAGYSTGPHLHWEIHHGYQLEKYENRIDPEKALAGEEI